MITIDKKTVALGLGFIGWLKYNRFINFITALKIDLEVLKIEETTASVIIVNKNRLHIPYRFKRVDLLLEKNTHLATNTDEATNLSVVPLSQIPIQFQLLQEVNIAQLQQSEVAITYSFFGIPFKRLYTPTKVSTNNNEQNSGSTGACGCKNH